MGVKIGSRASKMHKLCVTGSPQFVYQFLVIFCIFFFSIEVIGHGGTFQRFWGWWVVLWLVQRRENCAAKSIFGCDVCQRNDCTDMHFPQHVCVWNNVNMTCEHGIQKKGTVERTPFVCERQKFLWLEDWVTMLTQDKKNTHTLAFKTFISRLFCTLFHQIPCTYSKDITYLLTDWRNCLHCDFSCPAGSKQFAMWCCAQSSVKSLCCLAPGVCLCLTCSFSHHFLPLSPFQPVHVLLQSTCPPVQPL